MYGISSCSSEPDRFNTLEEIYIKEHPTADGTIHPDHRLDLHSLLFPYCDELLSIKGASGVAKTRELKYHKSVELAPPPPRLCLSLSIIPAMPVAKTQPSPPPLKRRAGPLARTRDPSPQASPKPAEACLEGQEMILFALDELGAIFWIRLADPGICAAARLGILYTMRERKFNELNI